MIDQDKLFDVEQQAFQIAELSGGVDGWLDLVAVQDNDAKIRVRVMPGSRFMFEVEPRNIGQQVVQELRRRADQLEADLAAAPQQPAGR